MIPPEGEAALNELAGGRIEKPLIVDAVDLMIASTARDVRGQILAEAQTQDVGVRELARRIGVSPSAVSRHLRAEGDFRISTAVIFANALNCNVRVTIQQRSQAAAKEELSAAIAYLGSQSGPRKSGVFPAVNALVRPEIIRDSGAPTLGAAQIHVLSEQRVQPHFSIVPSPDETISTTAEGTTPVVDQRQELLRA